MLLAGTAAFAEQLDSGLARHRPGRLCYVTWPMPFPGDRPAQEGQPIQIRVPIEEWYRAKLDAYFAHRTQLDHEAYFRTVALLPTEDYFVALGPPATGDDLFEGLAGE